MKNNTNNKRHPSHKPHRLKRGRPHELTLKWQVFQAHLPSETFKNALMSFVYYACRRGIEPAGVDDCVIAEYIIYLIAHDRAAAAASTVKYWNLIRTADLAELTPIANVKSERQADWEKLDLALRAEIDAYIATRAHLADKGENDRNSLFRAAQIVAAIPGGRPPASIYALVTRLAIDAICAPEPRPGVTYSRSTINSTLRALSTWAKAEAKKNLNAEREAAVRWARKTLRNVMRANPSPFELSKPTTRRLIRFAARGSYRNLVHSLAEVIEALPVSADRKSDLPRAAAALAGLLSLVSLRRPFAISLLTFDGDARQTPLGPRPKLSHNIEMFLKPNILALIDLYYFAFNKLVGRPPYYLFEKLSGGLRDQSAIGHDIAALLDEFKTADGKRKYDLVFGDFCLLGIKHLIDAKQNHETIADAAGFRTTANFRRVFKVLLDADAAARFEQEIFGSGSPKDKMPEAAL